MKKINCAVIPTAATASCEQELSMTVFTEDTSLGQIRGSIRSRGPIINETASHFGGGGHIFASGVRLKDFDEVDQLVNELDQVCKEYCEINKEQ